MEPLIKGENVTNGHNKKRIADVGHAYMEPRLTVIGYGFHEFQNFKVQVKAI